MTPKQEIPSTGRVRSSIASRPAVQVALVALTFSLASSTTAAENIDWTELPSESATTSESTIESGVQDAAEDATGAALDLPVDASAEATAAGLPDVATDAPEAGKPPKAAPNSRYTPGGRGARNPRNPRNVRLADESPEAAVTPAAAVPVASETEAVAPAATPAPATTPPLATTPPPSATPPPAVVTSPEDAEFTKSWTAYSKAGREAMRMRQYPEAETNYLKAVEGAKSAKNSSIAVSTATGNLIRLLNFYEENGRWEDYERFGERVVNALGDEDGRLNHIRIAMAKDYLEQGELESAARHLETVTAFLASKPQADTTDQRDALVALSKLRSQQERFEEAEAALIHAHDLALAEDADGIDTGLVLNELAWFYVERHRAQEAVPRARRAQEILIAGKARPVQQIAAADTLASALHQLERNGEALELYRQALKEESDASEPPDILVGLKDVYARFADVLVATGNRDEARRVRDRIRSAEQRATARDSMLEEADRRSKQASDTITDPAALAY